MRNMRLPCTSSFGQFTNSSFNPADILITLLQLPVRYIINVVVMYRLTLC